MTEAPVFFLPLGVTPGTEEEAYADFAKACYSSVPSFGKRIYSVNYLRDGVEWNATVGETLRGVGRKTVRRRGQKFEEPTSHGDPATVLAIFAVTDKTMTVMTDGHFRTQWACPFHCEPRHVTYFSQPMQKSPNR